MGNVIKGVLTLLLCASLASAGDLNNGYNFTSGEQNVNHTKLNSLVGLASINTTFYTDKTATTTPAGADVLLIYSSGSAAFRKTTLSSLLLDNTALITGQNQDTAPALGDFVLSYDISATGYKKATLQDIFNSQAFTNSALINDRTNWDTPNVTSTYFLGYDGGAWSKISRSNLFYQFVNFSYFTNLTADTAPATSDKLLVFDSASLSNRTLTIGSLASNAPSAVALSWTDTFNVMSNEVYSKVSFLVLSNLLKTGFALSNQLPQKFVSSEYVVSDSDGAGITNIAHSLPGTPQNVRWVLVCKTTDAGYAVGDEVPVDKFVDSGGSTPAFGQGGNATNIWISFTRNSRVNRKDGSNNYDAIDESKWRAKGYATYLP